MKLRNSFTNKTRALFSDTQYSCMNCGKNGQGEGGLSLHHIKGRQSNSAFNGIVLCNDCHSKCGHADEEESKYLKITAKYLWKSQHYTPSEEDKAFIYENRRYYD